MCPRPAKAQVGTQQLCFLKETPPPQSSEIILSLLSFGNLFLKKKKLESASRHYTLPYFKRGSIKPVSQIHSMFHC